MRTIKERLALAAALMLMASQGFAQTSTATTGTGAATAGETSRTGFGSLSPGNQKIARSLFLAQQPTPTGPAPLSLNQIAAMKGHAGWGEVFKQMKSQRLITAKNLGQVVSAHEASLHAGATGARHGFSTAAGHSHATRDHDRSATSSGETGEHHGIAGGHDHDDPVTVATASGAAASANGTVTHGGGDIGAHGGGEAHGR